MKVLKTTFYRILVKVDKTREQQAKEQSKIYVPDEYKEDQYATMAQTTGIVEQIGEGCFDDKICNAPQYKVGDRVVFQSHRGIRIVRVNEDGTKSMFRLLNDDDVWAVVELEEEDYKELADECRTTGTKQ